MTQGINRHHNNYLIELTANIIVEQFDNHRIGKLHAFQTHLLTIWSCHVVAKYILYNFL